MPEQKSSDAGAREPELDAAKTDAAKPAVSDAGSGDAGKRQADKKPDAMTTDTPADDAGPDEPARVVDENELARWPMPDAFAGSQTLPSYEVRGDTTIDLITHLEWQHTQPEVYPGCTGKYDTSSSPVGEICTWVEAKAYCQRYGEERGQPRWRLPTKIELESILDETRVSPAINPEFFRDQDYNPYWTSTPYLDLEDDYYFVEFLVGTTQHGKGAYKAAVRCVR